MLSRLMTVGVLALSAGLLLAIPSAQAKTFKGSFTSSGESIGIFSDFSFDGSTTNAATLNTGWGTDSLGDAGPGQSVSEWLTDAASPCTFKGLSGVAESGETLTFVGSAGANHSISGPLSGDTFYQGQSGSGCFSPTTGDFAGTETDLFVGGTGGNKNATGSSTYTFVGVLLSAPAKPGYGFMQWSKSKGTFTEKVPK
jgi:hypothetical protein